MKNWDTYALPASMKRSAITAFWHVNSPNSGILKEKGHKHPHKSAAMSGLVEGKSPEHRQNC